MWRVDCRLPTCGCGRFHCQLLLLKQNNGVTEDNCESGRFAGSVVEGYPSYRPKSGVLGLKVSRTVEERSTERAGMTSGWCNVTSWCLQWSGNCMRTSCMGKFEAKKIPWLQRCAGSLKHPFFYSATICVQLIRTFLYKKQVYMQTEDGFRGSQHRTVG